MAKMYTFVRNNTTTNMQGKIKFFLIVIACVMTIYSAVAETTSVPYNDKDHGYTLVYTTTSKTTAELTSLTLDYSYEPLTLEIPSTITIDGLEYTVTSIANRALLKDSYFSDDQYMPEKIVLPSTITTIGDEAFENNAHLKSINLPEGITTIGQFAFYGCTSLESIEFPNSLTEIEEKICQQCASLKTIKFGKNVTTIWAGAFYGKKVNGILQNVPQIKTIYCDATTPPTLKSNAFDSSCSATVYVPFGTLDAYETAWSKANFTFIEMGDGQTSGVEGLQNGELCKLKIGGTQVQLSSRVGAIYTLDGEKIIDFDGKTDTYSIATGVYVVKTKSDAFKIIVR